MGFLTDEEMDEQGQWHDEQCKPVRLSQAERERLLCTCERRADGSHRAICNYMDGVTAMMRNHRLVETVEQIITQRMAAALNPTGHEEDGPEDDFDDPDMGIHRFDGGGTFF